MSGRFAFASLVCVVAAAPALAAPVSDQCVNAWKAADIDANGVLERSEDQRGMIDRAQSANASRAGKNSLTRDEYLTMCSGTNIEEAGAKRTDHGTPTQASPNLPADRGKGDLTRGTSKLTEADVRKRIESQGYDSIRDLALGEDGVWRGTVEIAPGRRTRIGVDAQGDIVAQ